MAKTLHALKFENSYLQLPPIFYSRVKPQGLRRARMASVNAAAAELLGLDAAELAKPEWLGAMMGAHQLPGSDPAAYVYAGHQFGVWVPRLGDGRAINLGEVVSGGHRWDVQLKGSGETPYSRRGDGRAVLRSTIREYLGSEAMHALGVPTTRALCFATSDEPVFRETQETGAVLVRLAPTFIRFGTFEYFAHSERLPELRDLLDYVIRQHFPHLEGRPDRAEAFYLEVVQRTAEMIAGWRAVGFIHGVMNTDNMSILGLTLDYGPFAFMDAFDPLSSPNHSDDEGRYAYNRQPRIALWNLGALGEALSPILSEDVLRAALVEFEPTFDAGFLRRMRAKLGLTQEDKADVDLVYALLRLMAKERVDYSVTFRKLSKIPASEVQPSLRDDFVDRAAFDAWWKTYQQRLSLETRSDAERLAAMAKVNPVYVLRTHLAQKAIEQAELGDFSEVDLLLDLISSPFAERPGLENYAEPPEDAHQHVALSCSS